MAKYTAKQSMLGLRLFVLLVFALGLMYFTYQKNPYAQKLQNALTVSIAPAQFAVNFPERVAKALQAYFQSRVSLLAENEILRDELLVLQVKAQRLTALEEDNKQLLSLLGASKKLDDRFVAADVMAVNTTPFSGEIMLAKGSLEGVFKGQPVLDAQGLMGQVVSVTPMSSHVLLITDRQSAVPIQVSRSGLQAIAIGDGYNTLRVMNLPKTAELLVGDVLLTSGLGGRFPPGYPVGKVTNIQVEGGREFMTITVAPAANMHGSRHVLLVWPGEYRV